MSAVKYSSAFERVDKGYAASICGFHGKAGEMAFIAPTDAELSKVLDLHGKDYNQALFQHVIITEDARYPRVTVPPFNSKP